MKKTTLFLVFCLTVSLAFSQAVQRNVVILEIGTGTGCQYCPGAAMGAHDLITNGQQVAVIEYHNYNPATDPFSNAAAAARCGYYGISGYPTAFFDGTVNYVGGSQTTSMYPQYLPLYNTQYAVPAPLTTTIAGTNTGNVYNITLTINKLAAVSGTDLRAHLVLTESNIPYSWFGMTEIDDAERLMVPDANGTPINFNSGNTVTLNLTFTKDPSWVTNNCELIAFVQDHGTKTIYNGSKVALNGLYLPLPTNFTATPTSGCTPLTVTFTDQSTGATNWNWSFPGGTPSTSTLQNPVVVYNNAGTFDVTLNASNPAGNQYGSLSQAGLINVNTTPVAPTTPQGPNALCLDPPDQTYTTTAVANTTGYTWEVVPSTAGVITSNGISCVVNWDNAFTGIAQLKVRALNGCGNGPWTPFLNINISPLPGQAAQPAGPTLLCMNSGSTLYTTSGATNAMTYLWEMTPPEAGTIYPNGNTANISWSTTFTGNVSLKVKGLNNSCEGAWSNPLAITINPGPAAYNVTGGGVYCAIGGTGLPVGLSGSQTGTTYTLYRDNVATTTTMTGTGSAISFGNQLTGGNYTVIAGTTSGNCTNTMTGNAMISVDPQAPLAPGEPMGPSMVFSGASPTSEYLTTGGTYASSYSWEIAPAEAGTITGATTLATATWNPVYTGAASIKVKGVNSCGSGTYSAEFVVTVDVGVGIGETAGQAHFRLSPNPAGSEVSIISGGQLTANVSVISSLGEKVMELNQVQLTGKDRLDLHDLRAGIYFVRIEAAGHQHTLKLLLVK